MTVYVVTSPELGWDCVMGVFSNYNRALREYTGGYEENKGMSVIELEEILDHKNIIIHHETLQ